MNWINNIQVISIHVFVSYPETSKDTEPTLF